LSCKKGNSGDPSTKREEGAEPHAGVLTIGGRKGDRELGRSSVKKGGLSRGETDSRKNYLKAILRKRRRNSKLLDDSTQK